MFIDCSFVFFVFSLGRLLQHMDETPEFDCADLQILGKCLFHRRYCFINICNWEEEHKEGDCNFASCIPNTVLDEADRILDMGFEKAVNAIIENLPKTRQTLLFSATQTKSVKDLARLSLKVCLVVLMVLF